jgi:DNA-binding MarR family transcriptional regulator
MNKAAGAATLRLNEFLPYRLSIASNAVSKVIAAAYAERFGLSVPEWRLIAVLHESETATQQDLVRRTLMDKVAVSRAAQALAERGLVKREQDATDGRAWRLTLAARGHALYRRIAPAALEYERRLLEAFSRQEIAVLHDMLARLARAASSITNDDANAPATEPRHQPA